VHVWMEVSYWYLEVMFHNLCVQIMSLLNTSVPWTEWCSIALRPTNFSVALRMVQWSFMYVFRSACKSFTCRHTFMHTCLCVCVWTHACMHVHIFVHSHATAHTHACMHARMHTHTRMHACMHIIYKQTQRRKGRVLKGIPFCVCVLRR